MKDEEKNRWQNITNTKFPSKDNKMPISISSDAKSKSAMKKKTKVKAIKEFPATFYYREFPTNDTFYE